MSTPPRCPGFSGVVILDFVHTSVDDVQSIINGMVAAGYQLRMRSVPTDSTTGAAAPNTDGVIAGRLVFARDVGITLAPPDPPTERYKRAAKKKGKKR